MQRFISPQRPQSTLHPTYLRHIDSVANPYQAFWGAVKEGLAKTVFTCFAKVACDNRWVSHESG